MADASGRFVITYNGEIYNYIEIRAELISHGAVFYSDTDTEVVLEAYKVWGFDCLRRFNGMYAFALFDTVQGILFSARDRFGEKPFLFHLGCDFFAFASEYKSLLQHPQIPLEIDEWRLLRAAHNASTGLDDDRQTVFRSVQQLLPGEAMTIDVRELSHKIWRYWQVEPQLCNDDVNEQQVFSEFRELLIDSVRIRLRSDVSVGSCLSGGLDSSAIVCIVRGLLGEGVPYNTFTGRFPGTAADEWDYASQVIGATGVISHVVEPTVDRFINDVAEFMWHNELPVSSSSQFAQWCVFDLAKQRGVTVLLDGQGADECLAGYEQYFAQYLEALRERGETDRLARELPLIRQRYPLALLRSPQSWGKRLPFGLRHKVSRTFGLGTSVLYGLNRGVAERLNNQRGQCRKAGFDALTGALEQECFGGFLTTLLRYGDRNSMAHSREVRLPFCDHRIPEFVFRLPPRLIMGEVQTKRLLRESMRGILPEPIRTRWNKQGFRPPQDLWFKSPAFLRLTGEILTTQRFQQSEFWTADWWQSALRRVRKGELGLGWTIWAPLIIELWTDHFLHRLRAERSSNSIARLAVE